MSNWWPCSWNIKVETTTLDVFLTTIKWTWCELDVCIFCLRCVFQMSLMCLLYTFSIVWCLIFWGLFLVSISILRIPKLCSLHCLAIFGKFSSFSGGKKTEPTKKMRPPKQVLIFRIQVTSQRLANVSNFLTSSRVDQAPPLKYTMTPQNPWTYLKWVQGQRGFRPQMTPRYTPTHWPLTTKAICHLSVLQQPNF